MLKLPEAARRVWRHLEAIAQAADYDPREEIARRVARLERAVANLDKGPENRA